MRLLGKKSLPSTSNVYNLSFLLHLFQRNWAAIRIGKLKSFQFEVFRQQTWSQTVLTSADILMMNHQRAFARLWMISDRRGISFLFDIRSRRYCQKDTPNFRHAFFNLTLIYWETLKPTDKTSSFSLWKASLPSVNIRFICSAEISTPHSNSCSRRRGWVTRQLKYWYKKLYLWSSGS